MLAIANYRRLRLSLGLTLVCIWAVDGFLISPMQTLLNRQGGCAPGEFRRPLQNAAIFRRKTVFDLLQTVPAQTRSLQATDVKACMTQQGRINMVGVEDKPASIVRAGLTVKSILKLRLCTDYKCILLVQSKR